MISENPDRASQNFMNPLFLSIDITPPVEVWSSSTAPISSFFCLVVAADIGLDFLCCFSFFAFSDLTDAGLAEAGLGLRLLPLPSSLVLSVNFIFLLSVRGRAWVVGFTLQLDGKVALLSSFLSAVFHAFIQSGSGGLSMCFLFLSSRFFLVTQSLTVSFVVLSISLWKRVAREVLGGAKRRRCQERGGDSISSLVVFVATTLATQSTIFYSSFCSSLRSRSPQPHLASIGAIFLRHL